MRQPLTSIPDPMPPWIGCCITRISVKQVVNRSVWSRPNLERRSCRWASYLHKVRGAGGHQRGVLIGRSIPLPPVVKLYCCWWSVDCRQRSFSWPSSELFRTAIDVARSQENAVALSTAMNGCPQELWITFGRSPGRRRGRFHTQRPWSAGATPHPRTLNNPLS